MPSLIQLVLVLAIVAALGVAACMHLSMNLLLTWGMGTLCLAWLIALVTLPWNLHFAAKRVLHEIARSRELGIAVKPEREAYALRVRDRMFWISIGAHVFSAVLMAAIAWCSGGGAGYYFAGFYFLSMFFRPGVEWYRYLVSRLQQIHEDVRYPRDDVMSLRAEVQQIQLRLGQDRTRTEGLEKKLAAEAASAGARAGELDQRLTSLSRKFEETIDRLTDNREIISGVKAFLRLVREDHRASTV